MESTVQGFTSDGSPVTLSRDDTISIMMECHPWRPRSESEWLIDNHADPDDPFCIVCGDYHPYGERCSQNARKTYIF